MDDFISPLNIETYIEFRVRPLAALYEARGPTLSRQLQAEMQRRCGGDAAGMQRGCSGGVAEMVDGVYVHSARTSSTVHVQVHSAQRTVQWTCNI